MPEEMTPERIKQIRGTHYPATTYELCDEVDRLRAALAEAQAENERLKAEWHGIVDNLADALFGSKHFAEMKDSCRAEFELYGEGAAQIIRRWRKQLAQARKVPGLPTDAVQRIQDATIEFWKEIVLESRSMGSVVGGMPANAVLETAERIKRALELTPLPSEEAGKEPVEKKNAEVEVNGHIFPYAVRLWVDECQDIMASVDDLKGCLAHGRDVGEALDTIYDVMLAWLQACRDDSPGGNGSVPRPKCETPEDEANAIYLLKKLGFDCEPAPIPEQPSPEPHDYISTACQHGEHGECRLTCKFCGVACRCECGHPKRIEWGPIHG